MLLEIKMKKLSNKFIYIVDDTRFNKKYVTSEALKQEKECFSGIIIHEANMPALEHCMNGLTKLLEGSYETKEFHFSDMFNKKENFSNLSDEEFLDIVETMVDLVDELSCDIVVQSINDFTYTDHPQLASKLKEKYLQPMQTHQDDKSNCLILSVLRAKRFIEQELNGELYYVICDQGVRKPNNVLAMPSNNPNEPPINIHFKSSTNYPPLQLADFIAWSLSRQKQIFQQPSSAFSKQDINLLKAFSRMEDAYTLNTRIWLEIDPDISQKVPYDNMINFDRKMKGLDDI